jgi:hypothetical protein
MSVQFFRLWPRRPPDGSLPLGLSCDNEGLLLAGNCRLIEAWLDRDGHVFYRARSISELNALLTAAYGEAIDAAAIYPAVQHIAKLMTERNWSRATLAALHLHLPELADTAAAARVLEADALLKVTGSFDPDKHPRWPKGSQEEHGGEFRPNDGNLLMPVADPTSEPDPSRLRPHVHHWLPQAVRGDLEERGLLDPDAAELLEKSRLARGEEIYQDVTDTSDTWRIHQYDTPHRDYNRAVGDLVEEFIEGHHISAENPMTMMDAAELLVQIRDSTDPVIAGYREEVKTYIRTQGNLAEERFRQYRLLPPTARGSKKATMPQERVMSSEERATASAVEDRIYENLLPLGLEPNRDYSFYDRVPYRYTFVGISTRELLTPDVIVACSKALAGQRRWSIRIGIKDPETRKFDAVITTNGEHLAQICWEDWALALGSDAWERMEKEKRPSFSVGALKDPSTWREIKRRARGE